MVSVQVAASQIFNSHIWIAATLLMSTDLEDNSKGRLIFQRLFSWGKISSSLDLGIKYKHNFLNKKKTQWYASVQFSRSIMSDSLQLHGLQQPGFPVHHQLPEFTQIHVHWVNDAIQHLILCRPLLLPPSIFPNIRVFSNESALCIRWPKYCSFSFSISPSNEYSGLISFRMNWLDLLAVQGTLKSLLQHHSSKISILQHSAFFKVQLSHPYMTAGKTITLTRWTLVGKVISLVFNMLSRLVKTFLPRSKHLLISWLQSPSAVILEPPKIKYVTVSTVFPSIRHEVIGPVMLKELKLNRSMKTYKTF